MVMVMVMVVVMNMRVVICMVTSGCRIVITGMTMNMLLISCYGCGYEYVVL